MGGLRYNQRETRDEGHIRMASDDTDSFRPAINTRLLRAGAPRPPWFKEWYRLRNRSSDEDRLAVYQAVRDVGSLPPEAIFFLISWTVDAITLADAEELLAEQQDRLAEIKARHGLQVDEDWPEGETPEEYEQAQLEFFAAWDELYAEQLEAHGEPDMARTFREDREQFDRLSEAGRQYFTRAPAEDADLSWLEALRADIAGCLTADAELGRLEMLHDESDGAWQITVYPTASEVAEVPDFDPMERSALPSAPSPGAWHIPGDDDPGPAAQSGFLPISRASHRAHPEPDLAMEDE